MQAFSGFNESSMMSFHGVMKRLMSMLAFVICSTAAHAQVFTNFTTANGLGNNVVYGVYASGSTVYAATQGGLSISLDPPTSAAPIPTMSEWAMIFMASLMGIFAFVRLRRT